MKQKTLSPQKARTSKQICSLQTDNHDTKNAWIMLNGSRISICEQKVGESSTAAVKISRRDFDAFVRWYLKPQKVRAQ